MIIAEQGGTQDVTKFLSHMEKKFYLYYVQNPCSRHMTNTNFLTKFSQLYFGTLAMVARAIIIVMWSVDVQGWPLCGLFKTLPVVFKRSRSFPTKRWLGLILSGWLWWNISRASLWLLPGACNSNSSTCSCGVYALIFHRKGTSANKQRNKI